MATRQPFGTAGAAARDRLPPMARLLSVSGVGAIGERIDR